MELEKCLKKWKCVLDCLEFKSESCYNNAALFAEYFSQKQNLCSVNETNCLPINLKIFSQLNLENIEVSFGTENTENKSISISYNTQEIIDTKDAGLDVVVKLESVLINESIIRINEELKEKTKFYLDALVSDMNIVSEKMILNSRYKFA